MSALIVGLNQISVAAPLLPFEGDSLRVKWMDGQKFILHKVSPKETWSQISRRYNVPVDQLIQVNNGIEELKIGQIVNVPVVAAPAVPAPSQTTGKSQPVYYTIKHGETLYSVSKRFNMTVDEMRTLNRLDTDQLREGQQLIVKYIDGDTGNINTPVNTENTTQQVSPVNRTTNTTTETTPPNTQQDPTQQKKASSNAALPAATLMEKPTKTVEPIRKASGGKTLVQVTETGVGSWIPDGNINQDKYYGLHRTAPIGTIIKVTNRMNNNSVYVKIVGMLPDTGDNENLIIKVSQAVASKLNLIDPLFRAELSYGLMQ